MRVTGLLALFSFLLVPGPLAIAPAATSLADQQRGEKLGERKIALVIGNSAYRSWEPLRNAANDASHIAAILADPSRGGGFKVTTVINGTQDDLAKAMRAFAEEASSADVSVVYVSGHGFEHNGINYLVPIDAPRSSDVRAAQLPLHFVDVQALVAAAAPTDDGLLIALLDACRTRPEFKSEGTKGLERASLFGTIDPGQAVLFAATAPGQVAYDAIPDSHTLSPFAIAVGEEMKKPGKDFLLAFRDAASHVQRVSSSKSPPQKPQFNVGGTRSFYFTPPVASVGSTAEQDATPKASTARLNIPMNRLATVDETLLVSEVLDRYSPEQVLAMAEAGDPIAAWFTGYMLYQGHGLAKDLLAARTWLEKAAATGHPGGQLELAYFLLTYGARSGDKAEGERLIRASAAQGYAKAQTHLAGYIQSGRIQPTDKGEERRLLSAAAEAGHVGALALLTRGPDRASSIAALQRLAFAGNREGDHWLCMLAEQEDIAEAGKHCLAAALSGYADSRARTAFRFAEGRGLAKSITDARNWARLAISDATLTTGFRPRLQLLTR